jgi:hypothetical protein
MLLRGAGLEGVVLGIDLSGPALTVAGKLLAHLESYGLLPDRPDHHALGALLSHLLTLELGQSEAMFVAGLIVDRRLVEDSRYLDELRRQYIGVPAMVGGREAGEKDGPTKGVLGPEEIDTDSETKEPAPRYVNVCFTADAEGKGELDLHRTLRTDRLYYLRLDIGPLSKKTIVRRPKTIEEAVDQFFEEKEELPLEVALFSADFRLDEETAGGLWVSRGRLILPRRGPARTPDDQPYLLFAVNTPLDPCQAQLRICVYYENNLLQSMAVQAHITSEEREAEEGHWADVEYTLTANFAQVQKLPSRALNIFVNQNRDGTHTIGLKGENPEAILVNESQMKNATLRFRRVMEIVTYGEGSSDDWRYQFDGQDNQAKTRDQIHQDLRRMAQVGKLVWNTLIADNQPLSEQLQERLRKPGVIQISPIDLSAVFPWALVYDKPVDARDENTKACLLWQERRDRHGNLDSAACEEQCPHKDGDPPLHSRKDLVCPYGFWGFRHVIEVPLSTQEQADLHLEVELAKEEKPLLLVGYREERLNTQKERLDLRKGHEQKLDLIFQIVSQASKKALEEGMQDPSLHLVYFYTHCRHENPDDPGWEPYLELGQQQPESLVPSDLIDWGQVREVWRRTRPLVFINACQSLDFVPGTLADFLRNFAHLYASGVIGTEISTVEPLACEFAEHFFSRFVEGQQENGKVHTLPVGEVFRQVRGYLLEKHNPLGLIYTLYCSADLKVVR